MELLTEVITRIKRLSGITESQEELYIPSDQVLYKEAKKIFPKLKVKMTTVKNNPVPEERWFTNPSNNKGSHSTGAMMNVCTNKKIENVTKWLTGHGAEDIRHSNSSNSVYLSLRGVDFRISDHAKPDNHYTFDPNQHTILVNYTTDAAEISAKLKDILSTAKPKPIYKSLNENLYLEAKKFYPKLSVKSVTKYNGNTEDVWRFGPDKIYHNLTTSQFIAKLCDLKVLYITKWLKKNGAKHVTRDKKYHRNFYTEVSGEVIWITPEPNIVEKIGYYDENDQHIIEINWFTQASDVAKEINYIVSGVY